MDEETTTTTEGRQVCRFSCGAASALATKLVLQDYPPEQVVIVNAFLKEEHPDNQRFLDDCEEWFEHPIVRLRDEAYGASTHEVWKRHKFIKHMHYMKCSDYLKRRLLGKIDLPGDTKVLGFTSDEVDRFDRLCDRFPLESFKAPLIDRGIDKEHCLSVIQRAGLELPMMYKLGYDNANCIGCPKGGQAYWRNIREDFPEQFIQIQTIQESINRDRGGGDGADFLRFTSGPRKGERMSLAELPPGRKSMKGEPSFDCGLYCEILFEELSTFQTNVV